MSYRGPYNKESLRGGVWYIVAGKGPMRADSIYDKPNMGGAYAVTCKSGFTDDTYVASHDQFVCELTLEALENYQSSAVSRGIVMVMYNEIKAYFKLKDRL